MSLIKSVDVPKHLADRLRSRRIAARLSGGATKQPVSAQGFHRTDAYRSYPALRCRRPAHRFPERLFSAKTRIASLDQFALICA